MLSSKSTKLTTRFPMPRHDTSMAYSWAMLPRPESFSKASELKLQSLNILNRCHGHRGWSNRFPHFDGGAALRHLHRHGSDHRIHHCPWGAAQLHHRSSATSTTTWLSFARKTQASKRLTFDLGGQTKLRLCIEMVGTRRNTGCTCACCTCKIFPERYVCVCVFACVVGFVFLIHTRLYVRFIYSWSIYLLNSFYRAIKLWIQSKTYNNYSSI